MHELLFSQFVSCYYRLKPRDRHDFYITETESTNQRGVGPDSSDALVGTNDIKAPTSMILTNGVVMKKRTQGRPAVPMLQSSNILGPYGNCLLFNVWERLEDVHESQTHEESQRCQEM